MAQMVASNFASRTGRDDRFGLYLAGRPGMTGGPDALDASARVGKIVLEVAG
jgi:hypothetical protein